MRQDISVFLMGFAYCIVLNLFTKACLLKLLQEALSRYIDPPYSESQNSSTFTQPTIHDNRFVADQHFLQYLPHTYNQKMRSKQRPSFCGKKSVQNMFAKTQNFVVSVQLKISENCSTLCTCSFF